MVIFHSYVYFPEGTIHQDVRNEREAYTESPSTLGDIPPTHPAGHVKSSTKVTKIYEFQPQNPKENRKQAEFE